MRKTVYKLKRLMQSKKAVSPVIAVILLIAIAVAASVTVFAYTQGIIGGVTQANIAMSNAQLVDSNTMTVTVQNTGGTSSTIETVAVTGENVGDVRNAITAELYDTDGDSGTDTGIVVGAGSSVTIEINLSSGSYESTETIVLTTDSGTVSATFEL